MDDLGAEHLSQLSSSSASPVSKKTDSCTIFDRQSSSPTDAPPSTTIVNAVEKDAKSLAQLRQNGCERDGNRLVADASGAAPADSAGDSDANSSSIVVGDHAPVDEDSDGKEKSDITPENLKKIVDDVISTPSGTTGKSEMSASTPGSKSASDGISSPTTSADQVSDQVTVDSTSAADLRIVEDESPSKQALAFTIDFNDGMEKNAAAAAVTSLKYRNMVERFQNRHRRGASMSKIEDQTTTPTTTTPTTPVSGRASRVGSAQSVRQKASAAGETSEAAKVKMRIRDRSTSGVRDSSKRHSWSPRSSTHEPADATVIRGKDVKQVEPARPNRRTALGPSTTSITTTNISQPTKDERTTRFTPRSTAMQLALNKVEFTCPQPPLDDFRKQKKLDDEETVSEAGTYTVDGDNYTEEQKELMNIDKSSKSPEEKHRRQQQLRDQHEQLLTDTGQCRPTDLPLQLSSSIESRRRNNVLEISYYHDSTSLKPKISYLEKIKSRVKSITKSPDKQDDPSADRGTFTSVTTSGVLSKKPSLDARPRMHRKNSLTKSHIDSSEYVSAEGTSKSSSTVSSVVPNYPNTAFTDLQKAEYKLNVFAKQADAQMLSDLYPCEVTPLQTPDSPPDVPGLADTTVLKTAQTKSDWIQEWARNARARSATVKSNHSDQMSRSFNFENTEDSMLSDPISYHSKRVDRYRHHGMGDLEYASDTNLSNNRKVLPAYDYQNYGGVGSNVTARPPLSPSKIPSPVHTVGRTRGSNRTRGSLQDLSPNAYTPETDVYLQKTAVAISNLAQNLSRKNSLQSSPSSKTNSPRRGEVYPTGYQSQHYSADEYSPTHNNHHQGLHKRNLSQGDYRTNIMSHSLNSEQLNGMLVDYRSKQHHRDRQRQNSFDAATYSPRRMYPNPSSGHTIHQRPGNFIEQTVSSIKQHQPQQQSPIRRSSSFSSKAQALGSAKAMMNQPISNKSNQSRPPLTSKNPIQKSASSTSFRKMYSDYDDNIEYYINDEDDLVDDYCSSDEFDDPNDYYTGEVPAIEAPEPLTNTRYNKALLMRIERSKQKVAGTNAPSTTSNKTLGGGVIACPNTPEMPRRSAQNTVRSSLRQSVPRDSSLNRLRGEVPSSLASAKKQLLQSATTSQTVSSKKVQPKYMDISKYKTNQGGNFLRKDESKSTLVSTPRNEIKRSPSSASVVLNRNDPVRASNRSVKSAGGKPSNNTVLNKQKENELAMWRRRATYDPMKAAAEGRRKQEEAKKQGQTLTKVTDRQSVDSYREDF